MLTAEVYSTLGRTLHAQGNLEGALSSFQQAVQLQPQDAATHANLGYILREQGRFVEAIASFQLALELAPHWPELHFNLGQVFYEQGSMTEALQSFQHAIVLRPDYADAHYNLGVVQQTQGDLDAALLAYHAALAYQPDAAEAYNNLGTVYQNQHDLDAARTAYEAALRYQPEYAAAHNNLGTVLQAQNNFEAASVHYQTAIRLQPEYASAHNNLGSVLREQGDLVAAQTHHEQALRCAPDFAEAWWNCSLVWLAQGDLVQGWPAYEWRWDTPQAPRRFPLPLWDGTPLTDRTILVTAEQGLGDELLFASCVADLLAQAGHVVIECDPRLATLFARSFRSATICGVDRQQEPTWLTQVPPIDVYVPMGSLPLYLRPTLAHFPPPAGYLVPDTARCQQYQQRLAALGPGLKVGMAWRSRKTRSQDTHYPPLTQWGALLTLPGVHFVNLQYDDPREELRAAQQQWGVTIHAWNDLDLLDDLDGVAALLATLDLVIGPEMTMTALAGGLGRPVWRLTAAGGSWTSLGTAGCPWFPSMRVVCPQQRGQWANALARVAAEVARV